MSEFSEMPPYRETKAFGKEFHVMALDIEEARRVFTDMLGYPPERDPHTLSGVPMLNWQTPQGSDGLCVSLYEDGRIHAAHAELNPELIEYLETLLSPRKDHTSKV